MPRFLWLLIGLLLAAPAASAQDDIAEFRFGSDLFLAGNAPVSSGSGIDDLFMAGETVRLGTEITGNAHMAGRILEIGATVGGDAYVAGMELNINAEIAGDATLAGYQIRLRQPVGGDLRAAASEVTVDAPVAGYALLSGDRVTLNAPVSGDVSIASTSPVFGADARIAGSLTLYEKEIGTTQVPEAVIPAERISRKEIETASADGMPRVFSWKWAIWSFVKGVLVFAVAAALIAAVVPERLAALRKQILAAPFRSLWFGFLAQSAVIGAVVLLAITIIGLALAPVVIALAVIGGFIGYVIAAYAIGVGLLQAIGKPIPASLGQRALAGGAGALIAALIALVPFVGRLFVLAAVLAGVGALTLHLFRPAFFATHPDI